MAHKIKGRAGAPCLTCQHPKRAEIDARLARRAESGESISEIARSFGLSRDTVDRHGKIHLPGPLAVVAARHAELADETRELDVIATLNRCADRAERMLDAAYRWLEDPARPGELNLNPRSHEVEVIYEEHDGQRLVRKSAKLSELLVKAATGTGLGIVKGEWKIADPRRLLLDAVTTLKPVAELLGKASGKLKPEPPPPGVNILTPGPVNVLMSPEWLDMKATLFGILQEHPEALEAVRAHYERKAGSS